jgi:heavy metal translocating P-type ATPase
VTVERVEAGGRRWAERANADLLLLAVCVAGLLGGIVAALSGAGRVADGLWLVPAVIALASVLMAIVSALRAGRVGVDVLAALALAGAVAVHELAAAAVIALMVATGRVLESWATRRAESDLHRLLAHAPQAVHRYEAIGLTSPPLDDVAPGDLLLVKPGEVVPVDGRLESAVAVLDKSSLSGEPLPVTVPANDLVESGAVNAGPPFDMRAISSAQESTFAGIVRLVRESMAERAPFVRLADRFAVFFVPASLLLAGVAWAIAGSSGRAVAVLVVATPCPLILAAPIAVAAGLSRAARSGVIVKGGGVLERLAGARVLVLDKTGTVTRGQPRVTEVVAAPGFDADELVRLAGSLEQISSHVLGSAVVRAATDRGARLSWPDHAEERFGDGLAGEVDGRRVRAGRSGWVPTGDGAWARRVRRRAELDASTTMFVEVDGEPVGALVLEDPLRPDSARTVRQLRAAGVERIVMATGDKQAVAESVAAVLGVDAVLAERSPAEKVEAVRSERQRGVTVMVGDGVNDAAALAAADVGIALGAKGGTASSDAADVVLTVDRLDRIVDALRTAKRSRRIALESVTIGMGLSLLAMGAAAAGLLAALPGAIAQEVIDVIAIVNALRALASPKGQTSVTADEAALASRLASEHLELYPRLAEIREVADTVESMPGPEGRRRLESLEKFLVDELLPHERVEQEEFYPVVARIVGGQDPIGPMSRAHVEIAHLVSLLGRVVRDFDPGGTDGADVRELRRLLYGLHAVLVLHFAQEDEDYLSIVPGMGSGPGEGKTTTPVPA